MFSLEKLRDGNILIIGFRGTGKSSLVKNILHHKNLKNGLIINPKGNDYEEFENVVEEYNNQKVNDFLVIDDCIESLEILEKTKPKFFILIEMYKSKLPKNIEKTISNVFIFRDVYLGNRNKIYRHYFSKSFSFESLCILMDQLEDKGDCLYLQSDRLLFYHNKL